MKKGTFFVLSGPSGSGKGTVLQEVLRKSDRIVYSVSATSRSPRAGEVDGINYYFKSREEFETLIKADAFIEYTETYGNYYGTLKSEVEKAIENGKNIILEIDPVGARNVRAHYPDAVLMFLVAPDLEVLSSRLSGRGSESAETFKIRRRRAVRNGKRNVVRLRRRQRLCRKGGGRYPGDYPRREFKNKKQH